IQAPRELTREAHQCYLRNPDRALSLTQIALKGSLESKDTYSEGYCYFLFSKIYWVKANYQLSTEYGFKALKIFESSPYYQELSECLLSVARTLVELGNYHKAHEFIHRALKLGLRHASESIQACAYREHSYLLTELNQLDSALYYSDKGITLFKKWGDSLDISVLYGRKARIYHALKEFEKSRDIAYQALLIDSLVDNRRGLGISYYQVAQNEYALGNRDKAIAQLKQSLRINSEIGNLNWQIKAHELLSEFYLDNDMASLAASELQKVSKYKDELYNSEKNGQIQEMQSLHDLEAKESTIQILEQENALKQQEVKHQRLFLAFLLVAILFLTLLIFVLTRLRAIQNKKNRNLTNKNVAIEQQKMAIQLQAENLQQLDQIKNKLFSVISHDLRGPISNLQSLLDMFTKKLMTADEFVTLSEKLKENLNLTQRTLENLLNWSLSQMDGIKTEKTKIELAPCIDEACRLMDDVAGRKNIVLYKQLPDPPLYVWADSNQLQVILRNLIHNAIKFSSFNDDIHISARRDKNRCLITIKDSGIGMTEQEINKIIGSKEYFSKTGTEQEKGTGLGLLLCKEFIQRNGGDIMIKSSAGEGTEVCFTLALAEHHTMSVLVVQ
ncbi:MAG TPA: ATP-binding protein, partial [Chryseosolibacter sp.]|nr:ATP-binding protein [Chryseosolibacter sp.]